MSTLPPELPRSVASACVALDRGRAASIVSALREAGVTVTGEDERKAEEATLALIGEPSADALHRVRALAAGGTEMLLAILAAPDAQAADSLRLLDAGASDVVVWTDDAAGVEQVVARLSRWAVVRRLAQGPVVRDNLVGTSHAWRQLIRRVVEVAHFTTASLLLTGESGTGKELVARLVHTLDPRPHKREIVVLDCTTIVPSLAGSEFFGHERGAFTGAASTREGAFELADGGTLFLDEVGDLPMALQAQLLRVVQEHTYKRVGGNTWKRTEFRLVCATHHDLAESVARGTFRRDLYHRIATWTFTLPSLRERREDILLLARHFAAEQSENGRCPALDQAVERYLVERDYPGNIRDLRNTVQRLVQRYPGGGPITVGQIPEDERPRLSRDGHAWPDAAFESTIRRSLTLGVGLKTLRKVAEDLAVSIALGLENGSVAKASRRLGITERALQLRQAERRRELTDRD
jgi:transcriptional regulator with GAF, ATPase, and Fis domain